MRVAERLARGLRDYRLEFLCFSRQSNEFHTVSDDFRSCVFSKGERNPLEWL